MVMANNGKKEFPINGLEQDVASTYARSIYCYTKNVKGITKFAKNQMNRRFRRFEKQLISEQIELEDDYQELVNENED